MRMSPLFLCLLLSVATPAFSPSTHAAEPACAANPSGSPIFDQLRQKAVKLKCPLVIHLTGTSWCPHCVAFTKKHMETPSFRQGEGKQFVVWSVDTKLVPLAGGSPGAMTFSFIPEEAAKVIGCLGSKAPYIVLGPPAVVIIDPVSGKKLDHCIGASKFTDKGMTLDEYILSVWNPDA